MSFYHPTMCMVDSRWLPVLVPRQSGRLSQRLSYCYYFLIPPLEFCRASSTHAEHPYDVMALSYGSCSLLSLEFFTTPVTDPDALSQLFNQSLFTQADDGLGLWILIITVVYVLVGRKNNWPPLPEKFPVGPCFYHDITVDIPVDFQKTVKIIYYLWMCEWSSHSPYCYVCEWPTTAHIPLGESTWAISKPNTKRISWKWRLKSCMASSSDGKCCNKPQRKWKEVQYILYM